MGGLGDWLADIITGTPVTIAEDQREQDDDENVKENSAVPDVDEDPFVDEKRPIYLLQHHPSHRDIIKDADLKLWV